MKDQDQDSSLEVSWVSANGMEEELGTVASIHEKNDQEFQSLLDAIEKSNLFKIPDPIEKGHFNKAKQFFLHEQHKVTKSLEAVDDEYKSLLNRKKQLQHDIEDMKKKIESVNAELDECGQKAESVKVNYKQQLKALTVAKEKYEKSFNILLIAEEENNNILKATISFGENKNFQCVLSVNREHKKILGVESKFLQQKEVEDMMDAYNQTNNAATLLCTLKKLALAKSH
ncbi:uncharacterized protein LOC103313202 [Tribolium castaneum]|uniref:Kinetochore protein SPC25 n=1 Tax=Tribolium castaneum TaxID=7070 RepID=D6WJP9_TRICA|nr:PREDICTED: uncharacterized protein LOC103313202 [Tribolium castaneum]EFA03114.1 hypothetical protein TcasGA2_TC013024 [Tribolium castaneum]|eukprot:XP_008194101.1 PREDICTED: uncharacterized protein LOC103313202 [Tribolium castaneum]